MVNINESLKEYKNNVSNAYSQLKNMKNNINNISSFKKHESNLEGLVDKIENNVDNILNTPYNKSKYLFENLLNSNYDSDLLINLRRKNNERLKSGFFSHEAKQVSEIFNNNIDNEIEKRYKNICKNGISNKSDLKILKKAVWAKLMDTHDDLLYKQKELTKELINSVHKEVDYLIAYT